MAKRNLWQIWLGGHVALAPAIHEDTTFRLIAVNRNGERSMERNVAVVGAEDAESR